MSDGNGHRWSKFFWADWESDDKLRLCSFAAQGVWMRALCLMHKSDGYLLVDKMTPSCTQLAKIWGASARQIERCLAELLAQGVASRDETGRIYCRRMVNDIKASDAGREHVKKRWGNGHPNRGPNREPNSEPIRKPFSPESEAESEAESPPNPPTADAAGGPPGEVVSIDRKARRRERASNGNGAVELILRRGFETAPLLGGVPFRPANALRSSNDFIDSPAAEDALPGGGRYGQT